MRLRATRAISASPRSTSAQCCMVMTAIAASAVPSASGRLSATPSTARGSAGSRCRAIAVDGSTGITGRSAGSYEPVPTPTFTTVLASPSASCSAAAIRGSARR